MDIFLIEDDKLLKKCNDIWNKVSNDIKKEFDSKLISYRNFRKTQIKSYGDETKDSHDKKMPRVGSNYIYLVVILIDFVVKKIKDIIQKFF